MNRSIKKTGSRFDPKIFLVSVLCLLPIAAAITLSLLPSVRYIIAVIKFNQLSEGAIDLESVETEVLVKRQIQRHFLDYSVYIPVEDIVIIASDKKEDNRLESLMTKACGHGSLFVWIPLKISLPFFGEKVHEWCWKPSIQIKK
jgi:hypothetical protein